MNEIACPTCGDAWKLPYYAGDCKDPYHGKGMTETTDQYKCQSYVDDSGEVRDCTCGKCTVAGEKPVCAVCYAPLEADDFLYCKKHRAKDPTPNTGQTFEEMLRAFLSYGLADNGYHPKEMADLLAAQNQDKQAAVRADRDRIRKALASLIVERPQGGAHRNGTAQAVRRAHNKAIDQAIATLDQKGTEA